MSLVTMVNLDNWSHSETPVADSMTQFREVTALAHSIPMESLSMTYGITRLTVGMHTLESYGLQEGFRVHVRDTRRIAVFVSDIGGTLALFEVRRRLERISTGLTTLAGALEGVEEQHLRPLEGSVRAINAQFDVILGALPGIAKKAAIVAERRPR